LLRSVRIDQSTIEQFYDYLKYERGLRDKTIHHHIQWAKKIMRYTGGYPTREKLLRFMHRYRNKSKYTLLNLYKFYRLFFLHFLNRPDLIEGIKVTWTLPAPARFYKITDENVRAAFNELTETWEKALYLFYATTGLRTSEALEVTKDKVLWEYRAVIPGMDRETKRTGITFFNEEAEAWLKKYLAERDDDDPRLFPISDRQLKKFIRKTKKQGITPKLLRKWHSTRLRIAGVPDSYVDVFHGRAPRSVLAKFYDVAGLEELKRVYDSANLALGVQIPHQKPSQSKEEKRETTT